MSLAIRWITSLFFTLILATATPIAANLQQGPPATQSAEPSKSGASQVSEEAQQPDQEAEAESAEDQDPAPAKLTLDVSKDSPLIQSLYQATRDTKEQAILGDIAGAQKLVDEGADLKFVDPQGRTAMHWAVFGSSYTTKPKVLVAYEKLADDMIQRA